MGGTERQARANSEEHQRPHFKLECDVIISSSGGYTEIKSVMGKQEDQ